MSSAKTKEILKYFCDPASLTGMGVTGCFKTFHFLSQTDSLI
jgi:hypothetical protein